MIEPLVCGNATPMHVFHQSRRLGSSHAEPIFPRRSSFQRTQHSPSTNNGGAGVPSNHWPALEDSSTRAPSSWGPQIAAPHHQTPLHMPLAAPHLPNTADPLQQQLQLAASPSPFAQTPSSSVLMHDLAMEQSTPSCSTRTHTHLCPSPHMPPSSSECFVEHATLFLSIIMTCIMLYSPSHRLLR